MQQQEEWEEKKCTPRHGYMCRCENGDENNSFLHLWMCLYAALDRTRAFDDEDEWMEMEKKNTFGEQNADYYVH